MLTENYVKAEMLWKINTQGYKSAFTGWSFCWLSQRIAQWSFAGFFPRSDRPLINMIHVSCGISILVLMVVRLFVKAEIPPPPIIPKPKPMMTDWRIWDIWLFISCLLRCQ